MAFDPITAGLKLGTTLIDRLLPNKTEADMAKLELARMAMDGELTRFIETTKVSLAELDSETRIAEAQSAINAIEAGSDSRFKSLWRPALGWVCVLSFSWHFFLGPMVADFAAMFGYVVPLREFETEGLMTLLFGMLGLGAMRTYERVTGKIPPGQ